MKLIFIYFAVTQILLLFGLWKTLTDIGYPKCETNAYPPTRDPAPWFTIDLDAPPEERWKTIMTAKGHVLRSAITKVKTFIKEIAFNSSIPIDLLEKLMPYIGDEIASPIKEEMRGIAEYANMTYGDVVMFNLFYDLNPLCTSIVAQAKNGTLYHARNLDYGEFTYGHITVNLTKELREGVVNIKYLKNGKVSFVSAGYVGYAGVATGMKPNAYTFSLNARHPPGGNVHRYIKLIEYILGARSMHWVTPLLRNIMENVTSYAEVLKTLEADEMIAPVYYIVGGTKPGEGCILTKGNDFNDYLCLSKERWYILQTNYDHWQAAPSTDPRRYDGQHCMNETGQAGVGWPGLYNVLSTRPVLAKATTYTTLMQVQGSFQSYVRYPDQPVP